MSLLRNRPFERRLRNLVRAELRRSPALKARARPPKRQDTPMWVAVGFFAVMISGLLVAIPKVEAGLAALTVFQLLVALLASDSLRACLYNSPQGQVLCHLPFSDQEIFQSGWRRYLISTAMIGWLLFLVGMAFILRHEALWNTWFLLPFWLVMQWLICLASAVLFLPLPSGLALWGYLAGVSVLVASVFVPPNWQNQLIQILAQANHWLGLAIPWGWPNALWLEAGSRHKWIYLLLLIPVGAWIFLARWELKRLRQNYQAPSIESNPAMPFAPAVPGASWQDETWMEIMTEDIQRREFLVPFRWSVTGWLEKIIFARLSERQAVVAEWLLGPAPNWSIHWRVGAVIGAVALLLAWLWPPARIFTMFFGAIAMLFFAMPLFGGQWQGLRPIPLIALYPISFGEHTRVMLKCNLLRMLAGLPLCLVFGGICAWISHELIRDGLQLSFKFWLLIVAWQPLAITLLTSASTDDAKNFKTCATLLVLTLIVLCLLLALAVLIAKSWLASLLAWLLFCSVSLGMQAVGLTT